MNVTAYRQALHACDDWDAYLLANSGLPEPRGNIELGRAMAEEGDEARFLRYLALDATVAPVNSPHEFLAFCGVLGLGRLLAQGRDDVLPLLRASAHDPRWRTREAVAMALQQWGTVDMDALLREMASWADGDPLEQRAAAAAVCEPALLRERRHAAVALQLLDHITATVARVEDRRSEAFRALRKGLGYCWSVAVAALPEEGKHAIAQWFASEDGDVRWLMRENLKKRRLMRVDAAWVAVAAEALARPGPEPWRAGREHGHPAD